jgi:hypothetical protein
VLPPDGGKVSKQRVRDDFPAAAEVIEGTAEIHGVPEADSGGDDREPTRTILLRFGCTIAQPTEAMKADSAGKGVARLALVELDGHLPAECRQVDREERAYDRSRRQRHLLLPPLWLAWTAPEAGEYFRCALQEEGRLALFLTDYTIHGRRAINGRLAWFRPDAEWQEIIADIGTAPSAEAVTRKLARIDLSNDLS